MSGIDLTSELADLRAVFDAATGDIATIRDAGDILWPGDPDEQPEPTGSGSSPAMWLDIDFGRIGAGGDTFGVEMGRANLDIGVMVEVGGGAHAKALSICDALKAAFQGQDTAAMMFYPWEAYPAGEGTQEDRWFRIDYQIPYERREAI